WGVRMDLRLVAIVLESPTEEAIRAFLNDKGTVFWVDWQEEDDAIVEACEGILQTGVLFSELVDVNTDQGYELYIRYRGYRARVPLSNSEQDRHLTLCALNQILAPDFEVRFCIDSNGSDSLAFLPLAVSRWAELE